MTLIQAFFELLACPFATLARALDKAIAGVARRVSRLLDALSYEGANVGRGFPLTPVWHVTVPLIMLALLGLVLYGDALLYSLRFAALLDPHSQRRVAAPDDLEAWAVAAWIGSLAIWGAVAWDLSGACPGALPYANLSHRSRLLLGSITAAAVATCILGAGLFFGWGQMLVESGARHSTLAELFTVLYAFITIGALLVAAWSLPSGLVAAAALILSTLGLVLGLAFLPLAMLVAALDRAAKVLAAGLAIPLGLGHSGLNFIRGRLNLSPIPLSTEFGSIAPDISQHFLPQSLQEVFSYDSFEEEIMSDVFRTSFFAGRGALATYCLPLAGPNSMIKGKALFAPDRAHPQLSAGGVLDLSVSTELVTRVFAGVGRRDEAFDLLRQHWLRQLLPHLGAIKQFFWLEAAPLEDAASTEALLRELKVLKPGLGIAVICALPEPDQRPTSGFSPEPLFSQLRTEGVVNAVIYVDPLSQFARRYGAKVQLEALMNIIAGVLTANRHDPAAPSAVEAMARLGAGGDATFAFASRPVGAGKRKWLAAALRLKKGQGDIGELVIQGEAAAAQAASDPTAVAVESVKLDRDQGAFYVANLPLAEQDRRIHDVEAQLRRLISANVSAHAVVLLAPHPGLPLPGIVGDYVASTGILFNLAPAPSPTDVRRNGQRSEREGRAVLAASRRSED